MLSGGFFSGFFGLFAGDGNLFGFPGGDWSFGGGHDEDGINGSVFVLSISFDEKAGGCIGGLEPTGGIGRGDEKFSFGVGIFEDEELTTGRFKEASNDASDFEDTFSDEGFESGGGSGLGDAILLPNGEILVEGLGVREGSKNDESRREEFLDHSGSWDGHGGQAGIRTREGLPLTHLAGGRFRPLSHLSVRCIYYHDRLGGANGSVYLLGQIDCCG